MPLSQGGMKALISVLLGVPSVAMVARSLWSVQVPKILRSLSSAHSGRQMLGGFNAAPRSATDEEKDYQDMICLGRKGGRSLNGEGP